MNHPWRFPAGAGGDLCPVCAAPHFPFCPPPPPPPPPPLPPHPFPYDLHPPPPPPLPQFHAPFQPIWGPPEPHPYDFPDREAPHKRMRLGEAPPPFDPYAAAPLPPPPMPGRAYVEGERLLGLIRDHGRPPPLPTQWHGEPYSPDGFDYGGGRGYPPPNYNNPYAQRGGLAIHDHAGMVPPPPPPEDRHNAYYPGFVPAGGPQEKYFDRDHRYHQFHPEAPPRFAEAGNCYDSHNWHPEAGAVPPPPEPPVPYSPDYHAVPPLHAANSTLFPVLSGSASMTALPPSAHVFNEAYPTVNAKCYSGPIHNEGFNLTNQSHPEQHLGDARPNQTQYSLNNAKINIVNACDLFKLPLRASRPDHIVVILRGLPGSGKSYLAKALRDFEVENGGNAPRIHSMDDYFMIEVEKVKDSERSNSSGASKGRKQLTKVIEYCYEPEMEETYRSSMLNAFKKTLDEGNFTFVIVDDRNLRVADFAQFWASAKILDGSGATLLQMITTFSRLIRAKPQITLLNKSGYEVYLLEAPYKDPTGCAARNVHGFTLDDIKKMASDWEEAPPQYLRLDIHSLFHDDNLREHSIQEVDMDTEDADDTNDASVSTVAVSSVSTVAEHSKKATSETAEDGLDKGLSKPGEKWGSSEDDDLDGYKELGQSKWSKDNDEDTEKSEQAEGSSHVLSGLAQTYGTRRKSVSWGDRLEKGGFSIGAAKRRLTSSLIIGPGSGYNLVSNPLAVDSSTGMKDKVNNETKRRFSDQLRDEGQSFREVFDKRRQRIGVFDNGDDE